MTTRSLERWRKQAVEQGPLSLLERKPQDRSWQRKLGGTGEAKLTRLLACSAPPEGQGRRSLRRLADKLVAWEAIDSIGHGCVRQAFEKRT